MGSPLEKTHLLFLFTMLVRVRTHAGQSNLNTSDSEAFRQFQQHLGVHGLRHSKPCNSAGIFCENRVTGELSGVIRVTRIVLESQRLDGFLSPAIGRLSELRELSLPNNNLADGIPSEIFDCQKLEILNLRSNKFSGRIPERITSLVSLRFLDISSNRFSGDLRFVQNFPNLEHLSLADNRFTGKVPPLLQSLHNLQFLNLSSNDLHGPVPSGVPKRYIFTENSWKSSTSDASAPSPSPVSMPHKNRKLEFDIKSWTVGIFAGSISGNVSGLLCLFLYRICFRIWLKRKKNKNFVITTFSPFIRGPRDLNFLKYEDALSTLEIIGRGGCGEVYKAELPGGNGRLIAIKKIVQLENDEADLSEEDSNHLNKKLRQIRSEIETVGSIRHRNLLPLLAHVMLPDCHYLIYKFMPNGSLQDVLNEVSEGSRELEWPIRHKIAFGVACGLEYLHMDHDPRIIHRDIKPANILLDEDLEAHITDFGLAKEAVDSNTHLRSTYVMGTVGFIAPEYHQTLQFTEKCDIYSYGVLLAVLVTGKLPSDKFFQTTKERSLVKWLRTIMSSNDPKRAIDPDLLGNGFEPQMLRVLKVACYCTLEDPKQRPNSKDIRCMLEDLSQVVPVGRFYFLWSSLWSTG